MDASQVTFVRCSRCVIPTTRPDTAFTDGICSACIAYDKRKAIDWAARKRELEAILEHGKNGSGFDCIVPSSGGKDSTWQALTLIEMGARPLVVTASTCHLTPMGRANIDNLARYATTIEVTPNRSVRAKLNRLALELVGDISWPEHIAIHRVPFRVARDLGIPLIFYGECPTEAYGGPPGTDQTREMTQRWVSEFGGFLGLRPQDMVGRQGLTERDMLDYAAPDDAELGEHGIKAYFLGQFLPWDSHRNARVAIEHGLTAHKPGPANWWAAENLDNWQTCAHDAGMYRKFGYGRGCAQISVDIRAGIVTRDAAMAWLRDHDGVFPSSYAGVSLEDGLAHLGMTEKELFAVLNRFSNWDLFASHGSRRPILKEFAEC